MIKVFRIDNIKIIFFIFRIIDIKGNRRVNIGSVIYILKSKILVLSRIMPAFQSRIAEPLQI